MSDLEPLQLQQLLDRRERLLLEYEDLEGTQIENDLERINDMVYAVMQNCDELYEQFSWWDEFEGYEGTTAEERKDFDQEYSRLFHNCVTAIYSLINHTQRFVNKYGDESFQNTYSSTIMDYELSERAHFLTQLRHYTQKRTLPPLRRFSHSPGGDEDDIYRVIVQKEDLLEWDGWNATAQEYITGLDDRIDVTEQILDYREAVADFYDWFDEYARDKFKTDLELSNKMYNDIMNYDPRLRSSDW
ncbi:hypothetical protein [Halomicrobium urmianum]|uniref:hypothetical protein n=1 Tax=Halomicrobium urmianum TaxID=1586233 RepID=UPI001CD962BB|nr:hypothetical protein [Halomicrobium urmianum]